MRWFHGYGLGQRGAECDSSYVRGITVPSIILSMNLAAKALTQYSAYEFNSLMPTQHQSEAYGIKADGLYKVSRDYRDDDGTYIDAKVVFQETNLTTSRSKRLRKLIFGLLQSGDLKITVSTDEDGADQEYTIPVPVAAIRPDLRVVPCNREQYGRFIGLTLENINGAWFDLHAIDAYVVVLNYRFEDGE